MGGCRCNFRDCKVSYLNCPKMHFFHFPLKETERFKKWREYSQLEQILEFSEIRRKNTSICGRHFRPECFMNYKLDRLTSTAVPTIMRLSVDKALDFELDLKDGVLVDLEKPKLKHLLPPNGFECPLHLVNDKILIEKLYKLQRQQYNLNEPSSDCISDGSEEVEDINFVRPIIKRRREKSLETTLVSSPSSSNKKCRILNTCSSAAESDVKKFSTVVLASLVDEEDLGNEINIVETIEIENTTELVNNEGQLLLTNESFNYDRDEDVEFLEDHKNENILSGDVHVADSDATIIQIESIYKSPSENIEIINTQNELLEFDQFNKDYDALCTKYSSLENENKELKQNCIHVEELKKNILALQVENDNLKKSLKDLNLTREKLHKYSVENKKLKNEVANIETLKCELLSRREETKELKRLLEIVKKYNSKNGGIELDIKNKELNGLLKTFNLSQQQLKDTASKLKEVQTNLNNLKNENETLTKNEDKLKQALNSMTNNFDMKETDFNVLKIDFDNLQQALNSMKNNLDMKETDFNVLKIDFDNLQQKYWKLQTLKSQEATVSTSIEQNNKKGSTLAAAPIAPAIPVCSLTKAQLFNGIKRYICSAMVSLLRMEMFGNSDREWKMDERQIAVDILRLSEITYKYFTDEWRIRLPALRDAHSWLSQSQQFIDDEEDL